MTLVCVVHFSWLVLGKKKKNEYESLFYKKRKEKKVVTFFLYPKSENQIFLIEWFWLNSCDF